MKLLATILVLSLPAVYLAARYHSSINFFAAWMLSLGPRLPAIEPNSTIESAATTNNYETKANEYEIRDILLTSAVKIDTKLICDELFIPTRPPSQYKPSNALSNLLSSEFEIDI